MYKYFTQNFCYPPRYAKKILRVMKITLLLMLAALMQVSAAGFAQKVTINQKRISLKQVFDEINRQTGYNILWSPKQVNSSKTLDVNFEKAAIDEVLTECFRGTSLTYTIEGKTVVIREKRPEKRAANIDIPKETMEMKPVQGKVTDDKGLPLPGATVRIKGSTKGTVTDVSGAFTIDASPGDILVVSFLGYASEEMTVGSLAALTIVLKEAQNELDRVVVTALGIKKEAKSLAYNVQEIGAKEINTVKDANFVNSLSGKVAGVSINSSSSGPGGSVRIVMRGTKSIAGNNNALFVVDGVPLPSLNSTQPSDSFTGMGQSGDGISNINPEDIESVSVLSGPSAAALYGSQAANGVVIITTKRGSNENLSLTLSNSSSFMSPLVMPEFQNTYGSDVGSYLSWGEKLTTPSSYDPKDFFQTGTNITNSASISTGNDKNQTYFSVATVKGSGIIDNNTLDRYNFSFRNTAKFLKDKLNLDLGIMYIKTKEQNMLAQGQYFNPLVPIYLFPRGDDIEKYKVFERYNVTRNFKTQYWPYGDLGFQMQNPYWITNRDLFINAKDRYMMNAGLKYVINDWMNITGRVNLDKNTGTNEKKYYASTSGLFASDAGAYYNDDINIQQVYADVLLNINKYVNDFSITANAGVSIQDAINKISSFGGNLQSVPNLFTYVNVNLTEATRGQQGYHDQTQSAFGTTQLGYKGMMYLDASARTDWTSSLINTDHKYFFYPSVGLSGIVTDIFGIHSDILSYLKARVSYSEVGNAPSRFLTIPTYPIMGDGYPNGITAKAASHLEPERTKSIETGLNFMFWKNKLKLDITGYTSSTYNQLFNPSVSESYGVSSIYINSGKIDNKGIELSAGLNQKIGPVSWTSNLVYSLNRNTIKRLLPSYTDPDLGVTLKLDSLNMGGTSSYRMILVEGGSMGDIYVNSLKTDEHGYIAVNLATQAVTPDNNGFIKAGNTNPKYTLGFRNSFSYKNLNLSFLVNARVGGVGVSATQAIMDAFGVSEESAKARDNGGAIVNGYKIPAQPYYQTIGGGTSGIGSMYVYSLTNVRLGEVSLGYNIPLKKYMPWVKEANISLTGRNLFLFYNKAPFDPESTSNTGTYYQGIDYFMQPSLRNIGFAVRVRL